MANRSFSDSWYFATQRNETNKSNDIFNDFEGESLSSEKFSKYISQIEGGVEELNKIKTGGFNGGYEATSGYEFDESDLDISSVTIFGGFAQDEPQTSQPILSQNRHSASTIDKRLRTMFGMATCGGESAKDITIADANAMQEPPKDIQIEEIPDDRKLSAFLE